jgi:hypothetical protein
MLGSGTCDLAAVHRPANGNKRDVWVAKRPRPTLSLDLASGHLGNRRCRADSSPADPGLGGKKTRLGVGFSAAFLGNQCGRSADEGCQGPIAVDRQQDLIRLDVFGRGGYRGGQATNPAHDRPI